jgi:DNA-binding NarL/FixJ family response regulator
LVDQLGIVLVDLSRLVGEMIERAVARTHDMGVVGRAASLDELHDVAQVTDPDVVIVGLHDADLPHACVDLLLERPRMKVLGIEERDGHAQLYELRPEQVKIGEISPDEVIHTIRAAVMRPTPF